MNRENKIKYINQLIGFIWGILKIFYFKLL